MGKKKGNTRKKPTLVDDGPRVDEEDSKKAGVGKEGEKIEDTPEDKKASLEKEEEPLEELDLTKELDDIIVSETKEEEPVQEKKGEEEKTKKPAKNVPKKPAKKESKKKSKVKSKPVKEKTAEKEEVITDDLKLSISPPGAADKEDVSAEDLKLDITKPTDEDVPITPEELKDIYGDEDEEIAAPDLTESMRAQDERPHEVWKILFSGLDFAGKSSILAVIRHEFQKLVNPAATKLTDRRSFSFLGQEIAEWDLGGQRLYRIQYLKRPLKYYADTSILFYVIDILDEERYEEAIDFLYDTLQVFDKVNVNPLITIMFHKMDPEVERESKKNRVELKLTALTNKIKVLTYGRDVLFFRTSIFNRFSVINAFSKALLELFPGKNLVDYALSELAVKTGANIIILLDENRLILGQNIVSSDDRQEEELVKLSQNTLLSFLYLHENFKQYPFLESNYMIIQLEKYSFLWAVIEEEGKPYYLIVFKDAANFQDLLNMDVTAIGRVLIKLKK